MTTAAGVPIYEALVAELGDPFAGSQPARLAARPPVPAPASTGSTALTVADTDEIPAVTLHKNPTA